MPLFSFEDASALTPDQRAAELAHIQAAEARIEEYRQYIGERHWTISDTRNAIGVSAIIAVGLWLWATQTAWVFAYIGHANTQTYTYHPAGYAYGAGGVVVGVIAAIAILAVSTYRVKRHFDFLDSGEIDYRITMGVIFRMTLAIAVCTLIGCVLGHYLS